MRSGCPAEVQTEHQNEEEHDPEHDMVAGVTHADLSL